jgi:hypothetical protein
MVRFFAIAARALAVLSLCAATGAAGEGVELIGTWYVLVHYKDDNASNPETPRWDDRVWKFEPAGSRLRWTEYPIVVFNDESGRFERRASGQYARVLHFWEPSAAQMSDIRDGLQVNSRGRKSKTLRGSDDEGWRSTSRARAPTASIVTYTENWSIEAMPSGPVFLREDVLGSATTESLEGVTRYATTEVSRGGGILRGTYDRDGVRHGTFRMMRSGETEDVKGSGLTQGERAVQVPLRDAIEERGDSQP